MTQTELSGREQQLFGNGQFGRHAFRMPAECRREDWHGFC